jgi:hypothetical protein
VTAPVPLPPVEAVLLVPRRAALDAFVAAGWRAFGGATPLLDAERRRLLNLDLTDPDVALEREGELAAVAHVETDLEGLVTHVEVVGAAPEDPVRVAVALAGAKLGAPRVGGGAEAREWIWGPESGASLEVNGEPVRLWICAERAYGDRLWAVATVVRRG